MQFAYIRELAESTASERITDVVITVCQFLKLHCSYIYIANRSRHIFLSSNDNLSWTRLRLLA